MQEHIFRAIDLAQGGHTGEALMLLRAVLRRDPRQIAAWKWLGYLTPDPQEALAAARRALALDPSDGWALQSLAALEERARESAAPPAAAPPARRQAGPSALVLSTAILLVALIAAVPLLRMRLASQPLAVILPPVSAPLQVAPLEPSAEASGHVVTTSTVDTYTFEAGSLAEMQRALYRQGPHLEGSDEPAIAITSYRMRIDWEAHQTLHSCELLDTTVFLDLSFLYPQWIPVGSPQPALYDEWDRFMAHVVAHEEHHGAIALGCAESLAAQIEALGAAGTCDELQSNLNALIDQVYAACEQQQAAFDATEGHISFPLPR